MHLPDPDGTGLLAQNMTIVTRLMPGWWCLFGGVLFLVTMPTLVWGKPHNPTVTFNVALGEKHLLGEKFGLTLFFENQTKQKLQAPFVRNTKTRFILKNEQLGKVTEVLDKTFDGVKVPQSSHSNGGVTVWYVPDPTARVQLAPNERNEFKIDDFTQFFNFRLNPGTYVLRVENEDRNPVTKRFQVLVDPEKTPFLLESILKTGEWEDQHWAAANLIKIDRARFESLGQSFVEMRDKRNINWMFYYLDALLNNPDNNPELKEWAKEFFSKIRKIENETQLKVNQVEHKKSN